MQEQSGGGAEQDLGAALAMRADRDEGRLVVRDRVEQRMPREAVHELRLGRRDVRLRHPSGLLGEDPGCVLLPVARGTTVIVTSGGSRFQAARQVIVPPGAFSSAACRAASYDSGEPSTPTSTRLKILFASETWASASMVALMVGLSSGERGDVVHGDSVVAERAAAASGNAPIRARESTARP